MTTTSCSMSHYQVHSVGPAAANRGRIVLGSRECLNKSLYITRRSHLGPHTHCAYLASNLVAERQDLPRLSAIPVETWTGNVRCRKDSTAKGTLVYCSNKQLQEDQVPLTLSNRPSIAKGYIPKPAILHYFGHLAIFHLAAAAPFF